MCFVFGYPTGTAFAAGADFVFCLEDVGSLIKGWTGGAIEETGAVLAA